MNLNRISAIVTSFNEEDNIASCLECLRGMGEVMLVDSFSCDRTLEMARQYPVVIYKRGYESAAKQKNWAMQLVRNEWILILDSDEVLSDELIEEILLLEDNSKVDGFWIRRRSSYLGRKIAHCGWQRDKVLRLFRKGKGWYEEKEVHEEITLHGKEAYLGEKIIHHPYRNMKHHLRKMREYTRRGALEYLKRGGRFSLLNLLLHPPFRFFRMYIMQRGFLDGFQGFILCTISSYGVFLKYAKAWELRNWQKKD